MTSTKSRQLSGFCNTARDVSDGRLRSSVDPIAWHAKCRTVCECECHAESPRRRMERVKPDRPLIGNRSRKVESVEEVLAKSRKPHGRTLVRKRK